MDIQTEISNIINEQIQKNFQSFMNFLCAIISIEGGSGKEHNVACRVREEMTQLHYDEVIVDNIGNVIGRIGDGPIPIVYDAHMDVVGVGNIENWKYDPFTPNIADGFLHGRGACDNKQSVATVIYGAKILRDVVQKIDSSLFQHISLYVVASVMEENCDGIGLKNALVNTVIGIPRVVLIAEATGLKINIGHRGRMEINVTVGGKSVHASSPENGINALYQSTELINDIKDLNSKLASNSVLGKGSISVTHISCQTPSVCAVPDLCRIHIDRRMTFGEDKDSVLKQITSLSGYDINCMSIEVLNYHEKAYTGNEVNAPKYFPTWILSPETCNEHGQLLQAAQDSAKFATGKIPDISFWRGSTNGVASMGELNIPSLGFGAGDEMDAHTANDRVNISDLKIALAFYAHFPLVMPGLQSG